MAVSFKGAHFPTDILLTGVRWSVAYPLSTRHVEELMRERGVSVEHSTVNRWVVKYSPQLEAAFHRHKRPVWRSWRMDETSLHSKGRWSSLYRAVDKTGQTSAFLLTEHRDEQAAKRFLTKALRAMASLRRSLSTAVRPMPPPFGVIMLSTAPRLVFARSSIAIIFWNRIITP